MNWKTQLVGLVFAGLWIGIVGCSGNDPASGGPMRPRTENAQETDEGVRLRLLWPPGARFVHRLQQNFEAEVLTPGAETSTGQRLRQTNDYVLRVTGQEGDGGTLLDVELASVETTLDFGSGMLSYNSSEGSGASGGRLAGVIEQVLHTPVRVSVNSKGEILRLDGVEPLIAKARGDVPPQALQMVKSLFSQENLESMIFPGVMPDRPVRLGDIWSGHSAIDLGPLGAMTTRAEYRFEGWEEKNGRRCARIGFSGSITNQPGGAPTPTGLALQVKTGSETGRFWYSPDLGHVVEAESERDLAVDMGVPPPPGTESARTQIGYTMKQQFGHRLLSVEGVER